MYITESIRASINIKEQVLLDDSILHTISGMIDLIVKAYRSHKKVLLCGNGGSAADAQHIAGELSGKLYIERPPLYAEALHVNTSYLTAVANDQSYSDTFARAVDGKGNMGDILICLSTSGNSANVVKAAEQAKLKNMITFGMTGVDGGSLTQYCDHVIKVPSHDVARIQEVHMLMGHIICAEVESQMFGKNA